MEYYYTIEYYYSSNPICNNPNCSCVYCFNPYDTKTTVFEHRKPRSSPVTSIPLVHHSNIKPSSSFPLSKPFSPPHTTSSSTSIHLPTKSTPTNPPSPKNSLSPSPQQFSPPSPTSAPPLNATKKSSSLIPPKPPDLQPSKPPSLQPPHTIEPKPPDLIPPKISPHPPPDLPLQQSKSSSSSFHKNGYSSSTSKHSARSISTLKNLTDAHKIELKPTDTYSPKAGIPCYQNVPKYTSSIVDGKQQQQNQGCEGLNVIHVDFEDSLGFNAMEKNTSKEPYNDDQKTQENADFNRYNSYAFVDDFNSFILTVGKPCLLLEEDKMISIILGIVNSRNELELDSKLDDVFLHLACVKEARQVFNKRFERGWENARYAKRVTMAKALKLFDGMTEIERDYEMVIKYEIIKDQYKYVYKDKEECVDQVVVKSAHASALMKMRGTHELLLVFKQLSKENVVSWTSMTTGNMHFKTSNVPKVPSTIAAADMKKFLANVLNFFWKHMVGSVVVRWVVITSAGCTKDGLTQSPTAAGLLLIKLDRNPSKNKHLGSEIGCSVFNDGRQFSAMVFHCCRSSTFAGLPLLQVHTRVGSIETPRDCAVTTVPTIDDQGPCISFEKVLDMDFMKLLDLDNPVDEARYRMAREEPVSPTLPIIEFPSGKVMAANNSKFSTEKTHYVGSSAENDYVVSDCSIDDMKLSGIYMQPWSGKEQLMAAVHGLFEDEHRLLPQYGNPIKWTTPGNKASVYGKAVDKSSDSPTYYFTVEGTGHQFTPFRTLHQQFHSIHAVTGHQFIPFNQGKFKGILRAQEAIQWRVWQIF